MAREHERLERLLAAELGECCEGDVRDRLRELERIAASVPDDPRADLAALSALGDGTRYRIVRVLAAAEGELCVCELSPLVDVSDSAVSHALSDLTDAGLVTRRKEEAWRYYDATDRAKRLLGALDATREGGAA
ncbi:MAG: ArsR/SmtB family transcription factor [Haloferacaceae archaeon]